jgi:hypothetical protein
MRRSRFAYLVGQIAGEPAGGGEFVGSNGSRPDPHSVSSVVVVVAATFERAAPCWGTAFGELFIVTPIAVSAAIPAKVSVSTDRFSSCSTFELLFRG